MVLVTKIINKHQGELLAFFTMAMTSYSIAPITGTRTLKDHYAVCAVKNSSAGPEGKGSKELNKG